MKVGICSYKASGENSSNPHRNRKPVLLLFLGLVEDAKENLETVRDFPHSANP